MTSQKLSEAQTSAPVRRDLISVISPFSEMYPSTSSSPLLLGTPVRYPLRRLDQGTLADRYSRDDVR